MTQGEVLKIAGRVRELADARVAVEFGVRYLWGVLKGLASPVTGLVSFAVSGVELAAAAGSWAAEHWQNMPEVEVEAKALAGEWDHFTAAARANLEALRSQEGALAFAGAVCSAAQAAGAAIDIQPGAPSPKPAPRSAGSVPGSAEEGIIDEAEIAKLEGMRTHTIGGQAHELAAQGREFDRLMQKHYSARGAFNEVPIRARTGKYRRLDTYDPVEKEIISRKSFAASNGQLAFADKDDVIGYLQEFALKYRNGAVVPKVPSAGSLAGKTIVGRYVLEIPPQNYPVPPFVLEQAKIRGIIIRDALGRTL